MYSLTHILTWPKRALEAMKLLRRVPADGEISIQLFSEMHDWQMRDKGKRQGANGI